MKRTNLLLTILSIIFIFSACEKETYIKKIYYIENASNNEIYLSYDNKYNNNSIERKLEPNHYDALYSYYIIDTDESSSKFDDMEWHSMQSNTLLTVNNRSWRTATHHQCYYSIHRNEQNEHQR